MWVNIETKSLGKRTNIFDRKLIYSTLEIIRRLGGVVPGRTIDGLVGVLEDFLCRTVHIFVVV